MKPVFDNGVSKLFHTDARSLPLKDKSVHCIITSPPYYGMRAYDVEPALWNITTLLCEHEWKDIERKHPMSRSSYGSSYQPQARGVNTMEEPIRESKCVKCGAWWGKLGEEEWPEQYIDHLIEVFLEAKRVLRDDGVMWVNLGDTYRNGGALGIPWRFALRMTDPPMDMLLRSEVIWSKSNPFPENLHGWQWTEVDGERQLTRGSWRCTESHEPLFQFSKAMNYYGQNPGYRPSTPNHRSVWDIPVYNAPNAHYAMFPEALLNTCILSSTPDGGVCAKCGAPWAWGVEPILQWLRTCECETWAIDIGATKATVLDPFCGGATTVVVAQKLGRAGIGADSSEKYLKDAVKRMEAVPFAMFS
jgi:DNA modification methylase